jgi:hypothetical protein
MSGGQVLAAGQLAEGRIRLVLDSAALGSGKHTLVVRYDGDGRFAPNEDRLTLTVTKPRGKR